MTAPVAGLCFAAPPAARCSASMPISPKPCSTRWLRPVGRENSQPEMQSASSGLLGKIGPRQHAQESLPQGKWNKAFDVETELLIERIGHRIGEAQLRKSPRQLLGETGKLRLDRVNQTVIEIAAQRITRITRLVVLQREFWKA